MRHFDAIVRIRGCAVQDRRDQVLPDPAWVDILLRRRELELGLVNEQQA